MDENAREKRLIYKAVRNYLANELGLNRTAVEAMLRQKIDERNPEKLVSDAVAKYFGTGTDSWDAKKYVESSIRETVRKRMEQQLREGGGTYLDALVQRHVDEICGTNGITKPIPADVPRPNVSTYPYAVHVKWTAVNAILVKWANALFAIEDEDDRPVIRTVLPEEGKSQWQVRVSGLRGASRQSVDALSRMLGSDTERAALGMRVSDGYEYRVPERLVLSVIGNGLGGMRIATAIAWDDGLLCLPPANEKKS